MKEEIVPFKIAKLAKEKMFELAVDYCYIEYIKTNKSDNPSFRTKKGEIEFDRLYSMNNPNFDGSNENWIQYAAPTTTMLQKWLREKHNIHIEIQVDKTTTPKYCYEIFKYKDFGNWSDHTDRPEMFLYLKYEECLEDALIKALKLIK